METPTENICLGGTFSPIHVGHLKLLEEAFTNSKMVSVGLTSDELATRNRERTVEPFDVRKKKLVPILERLSENYSIPFSLSEINDRFGFALRPQIDSIVVSEETEKTVDEIDEERRKLGLPPLKRFVLSMVLDGGGNKISSTRISMGEVDVEGNVIKERPQKEPMKRICVHLGSKNPEKGEGVTNAFRRHTAGFQLFQYNISSRERTRKMDILEGARHRTDEMIQKNSRETISPSDYFVGVEAGVVEMKGTWFLIHGCFILNVGFKGIGVSSGIEVPSKIIERIMVYKGHSWETKNILGMRTSLIEKLSGGTVSRIDLVEQATRMALISLTNEKKDGRNKNG